MPYSFGVNDEFLASPRIDNLTSVYASLEALLNHEESNGICVAACLDNEEVGSRTLQGADGDFLENVLRRIAYAFRFDDNEYYKALASSFMLSADNAHALHPNHPEKSDPTNRPVLGGGIVINGRVIAGFHGAGGEIGHITMDPTETEACGCGKFGCAEQYCSATGVVRMAKRYLASHDTPSVLRDGKFECKDVFAAAANGDEAANEILEQVFEILGRFLASIACVADPEVIVLGGGVSKAGQPLIDGATKYFHKYAFHACRSTRITLATLGNDAGAYGAFKLALDEFGA